jgi:DNA invertase Pin-like site-specific DNA recombinase
MLGGVKTAIYLRQSLDRDRNQLAVDRQREDLLALCARKGWDDPLEYADDNISAKKGSRRPAFDELCRDIRDGVIGRLAVWDDDRLRRTVRDGEDFIDLAEARGIALANVGGDIDLSTPQGRMFFRMKGTIASYEIEHKAKRQKRANRQRAMAGKAWVQRSFGYDGNKIVKREADAIRRACRDLLNGASLWSIAQQWNSQGLTTVKGYAWTGGQVREVLLRASNAGLVVYGVKGHKNRQDAVLEGVQAARPAIVKRDVWDSVCTLLADPKRHTGKSPGRRYLLSGIAVCGDCGKTMGSTIRITDSGKRAVYQCKRVGCMKIVRDLDKTDQRVIDTITRRLAKPDAAVTLAKPTVDTAALRDAITELEGQITAANAEYDDGIIDGRRLQGRVDRVNEKLAPLKDKLLGVHMSRDIKELAGKPDAAARFAALPLDRRRGVIDTLATVTIHRQVKKGGRFEPAAITVDWK